MSHYHILNNPIFYNKHCNNMKTLSTSATQLGHPFDEVDKKTESCLSVASSLCLIDKSIMGQRVLQSTDSLLTFSTVGESKIAKALAARAKPKL
jgi:hypothetical protein